MGPVSALALLACPGRRKLFLIQFSFSPFHSSSPGLTGRSSIPETAARKPRSRGVLGPPLSRRTTAENDVRPHSRGTVCPRFANTVPREKREQGMPGARCTRGLVCKFVRKKRTRAYRFSGGNPAFPARWFYGLLRALPGDRAFLPPSHCGCVPQNLAPASGRQDHTTSPFAANSVRLAHCRVHRISPRVRDDRDPPLSSGETGRACSADLPDR
jgi:hypothetical protein